MEPSYMFLTCLLLTSCSSDRSEIVSLVLGFHPMSHCIQHIYILVSSGILLSVSSSPLLPLLLSTETTPLHTQFHSPLPTHPSLSSGTFSCNHMRCYTSHYLLSHYYLEIWTLAETCMHLLQRGILHSVLVIWSPLDRQDHAIDCVIILHSTCSLSAMPMMSFQPALPICHSLQSYTN